jgi:hypothetical protein
MVVLLPAPLGPRRLNTSPSWMSKLTPSTAVMLPYRFDNSLTSTNAMSFLLIMAEAYRRTPGCRAVPEVMEKSR